MKKTIYKLFFAATALVLAAACTPEVDDNFDKSPSERSAQAIADMKQVLESSANGWVLPMYGNLDFGGRTLLVSFKDGRVTAASEFKNTPVNSRYKVFHSTGTILSFDDYNTVIHQFSDPSASVAGYGSNGKGFEADLEYNVLSASKDSVVLQGRKHGMHLVMTPLQTEWDEYFAQVKDIEKKMMQSSTYFNLNVADKHYLALRNGTSRTMNITNTDTKATDVYAYCVTPTGVKFYEPIATGGAYVQEFNFAENDEKNYGSTTNEKVSLQATVAPLPVQLMSSRWYIKGSDMSDKWLQLWRATFADTKKWNTNKPIAYYGQFGNTYYSSSYGYNLGLMAFVAYKKADGGASGWVVHNIFSYEMIDEETISLTFTNTHKASGSSIYSGCPSWKDLVNSFVGEFKVTADNKTEPTAITITSVTDPDMWATFGTTRENWTFSNGDYE